MKKGFILLLITCLWTFNSFSLTKKNGDLFRKAKGYGYNYPEEVIPLKTVWKYNLVKNKTVPVLVFAEGMIIWGDEDGKINAVDATRGKIKWEFKADGPVYEKPTVLNAMVYFCSYDGNVHALDIATGREKWKYYTGPEFRCTPVVFGNNVVVMYKKQLISLDIETGLELWKKNCFTINYMQYLQKDSIIYFSDNLQIVAINAASCTNMWQYQQQIYGMSRLQAAFNFVYYTSVEGVFSIQISNGKPKWKFPFDKNTPPMNYSNLTINDSALYVPVDFTLYVFNAVTGKILWGYKSKTKKDINNVSIDKDKTYFTESSDMIFAISKVNTKKIEKYKPDIAASSQLHVENNNGYFVASDGFIYAVKFP